MMDTKECFFNTENLSYVFSATSNLKIWGNGNVGVILCKGGHFFQEFRNVRISASLLEFSRYTEANEMPTAQVGDLLSLRLS